jgi:hypothetical protein
MDTKMAKRAVDLSVEELAAMGARAARLAAQDAQKAGLIVTGTSDVYEEGQARSTLAQLHPTGAVTLVKEAGGTSPQERATIAKRSRDRAAD